MLVTEPTRVLITWQKVASSAFFSYSFFLPCLPSSASVASASVAPRVVQRARLTSFGRLPHYSRKHYEAHESDFD